jgi:SAM-dependent methyltransferase
MAEEEFDDSYMTRLESAKGHWWVRGMQEVGAAILGDVGSGLAVLDAGCGAGTNLGWLARLAHPHQVRAVDVAAAAVSRCRRQSAGAEVLQASVSALPYADGSFDLIVSMDVLQHLTEPDAAAALAESNRVLCPGGRLLVRTNAAFGRGRVSQRTDWRLYSPATLRRSVEEAGLELDFLSPVNMFQGLWASIPRPWLRAHQERENHTCGQTYGLGIPQPASPLRNAVLVRAVRAEARWFTATRRPLPYGHSLYALAHRPRSGTRT